MPDGTPDPALFVEQLRHRSEDIVAAELDRLATRVPQLNGACLQVIGQQLREMADAVVPARVAERPADVALLRRLFALDDDSSEANPSTQPIG